MNFEHDFFDALIDKTLFYSPKIEIKPVHLANGFFRAVCGQYMHSTNLHAALHPSEKSTVEDNEAHHLLRTLFTMDNAVFGAPRHSSYTMSHITHITNDYHDRRTGEWLEAIISHDEGKGASPARDLIRTLLLQDNDELSLLSLPLIQSEDCSCHPFHSRIKNEVPESLNVDENGVFRDPLVAALRRGFDLLAAHAMKGSSINKLETLRRFTLWGCISIYLHLANSGRMHGDQCLPLLCNLNPNNSKLMQEASIQSYQWVGRSIDHFFRERFSTHVNRLACKNPALWETDEQVKQIIDTMVWKSYRAGMQQYAERLEQYTPQCMHIYNCYRNMPSPPSPYHSFAQAITDMIDFVFSSSPDDIARALGVRIGLLTTTRQQRRKVYMPNAELIELFVLATIPPNTQWTLNHLTAQWAKQYGLLFGSLGTENAILDQWGIRLVDSASLHYNTQALIDILATSGYIRHYSDGVIMVSTQEHNVCL